MTDTVQFVSKGLAPCIVPLLMSGAQWADKHFYLSKGSSSIEGKWASLPSQVAILNWMGSDELEILTIRKAARLGVTKMMVSTVGYYSEHKQRNTLFYQPTDGDASDFVSKEINPMLVDVQAVGDICRCSPDKKSKYFTTTTKTFINAILDVLGGKSPRNYRRLTKDVVFYDELSGFDIDIGGEGSPVKLGDTRVETSSFPKSIRGSTPKTKNSCLISSSIGKADIIMFRFLPCPDCKAFFRLKWMTDGVYHFDIETADYICEHCGTTINYSQFPDMDNAGRWQTDDGTILYDEEKDVFVDHDGEHIDTPRHIGVDGYWSAYSYFKTWEEIVREWVDANKRLKEIGDHTELKTFINTVLGQEWEERGERVDGVFFEGDRLDQVTEKLSNDILVLTMFVDVQGGKNARLEYEICGHGFGEESWSVEYGVVKGDPDSGHVWDHIDEIRRKIFYREDGVPLRIAIVGVDSGWNPDPVYKFTTPRQRQRVFSTKGHSTAGKPIVENFSLVGKSKKTKLFMIGADTAKTVLYYRLNKIHEPGPGFCHFPEDRDEEYFLQLTAEEKQKKKNRSGRIVYEWVKIRERNEALDCRVGNMAMIRILNPSFPAVKKRLNLAAAKIEKQTSSNDGPEKRPKRKNKASIPVKNKRVGGFVNAWKR